MLSNWILQKTIYHQFLATTICLFSLLSLPELSAQGVDKIPSETTTAPTAESTWQNGENLFLQATKLEEDGRMEQAASAYENAVNIFRGLQLIEDSFKKDLVSLRITTCKLRSSSLRRITQNAKAANAEVNTPSVTPVVTTPKVETKVTEKPMPRTGSIIEQISQMESEIAALRTENLALIENMKSLKGNEAELARIKGLEKTLEQRRLEVEALKSNMGFVETRWTKEVEAKIAAQNEVKAVKTDAEQQMSKLLQEKTLEMQERIKSANELAKNEREKNEKRINEHYKNELAKMKTSLDSYQASLVALEQKHLQKITHIQAEHAKVIAEKEKQFIALSATHAEALRQAQNKSEQTLLIATKKTQDLETQLTQDKLTLEQGFKAQLEEKEKQFIALSATHAEALRQAQNKSEQTLLIATKKTQDLEIQLTQDKLTLEQGFKAQLEEKEKQFIALSATHAEALRQAQNKSEQTLLIATKKTQDLEIQLTQDKLTLEQGFKAQLEEKEKSFSLEKTNLERTASETRVKLENQIKALQDQQGLFESNLKQKNQEETALLKAEKQTIAETSVKQKIEFEIRIAEQQKQLELLQAQAGSVEEQKMDIIKKNEKATTEKLTIAQKEKEEALKVMKKSLEAQIENQKETISHLEKQLSSTTEEAQVQLKTQETLVAEKNRLETQIESTKNELVRTKELTEHTEKDAKNKITLMQKEMENAISATQKAKSQQTELEDLVRKRDEEMRKMRQNQVSLKEYQRKQEALEALMTENLELKKQLQDK